MENNPMGVPYQPGIIDSSKWELIKNIDQFNKQSKSFFDATATIWDYLSHPMLIWNGFVNISYWVLLIACISYILIFIITNDKKQLQNGEKAFAIYFLIRLINLCVK